MTYRGIFEYEYPVEHKEPVGIDVYLHGDCVKGKIIEWEYKAPDQEQYYKDLAESYEKTINKLTKAIAEQEPRKGHWVHGEYCSECGCDVPAYIIDWKWKKDMNAKYCPNCGADMR